MVYGLAADCFILFELPHIYKLFDESILIEKKNEREMMAEM